MRRKFQSDGTDGEGHHVWFTSDTHFGHPGILFMRPEDNVEGMDASLVRSWNAAIGVRDHVFHLGDFSFHRPLKTLEILGNLNGIKHLIRGNHDIRLNSACLSMFDGGVQHYHELTFGSQLVVLGHFPFRSWNGMHHDSWNLHGHSHGSLKPQGKQLDVGVDTNGYSPYSFAKIAADMDKKKFVRTDHHGLKKERTFLGATVDEIREAYVARAAEAYLATKPEDLPQ